jgi:hypothetical protein
MSIFAQLKASDDQVVSYLNKLWNDDNTLVSNNKYKNIQVSKDDMCEVQTKSIIQQLIDSKIINVSLKEMYENNENKQEEQKAESKQEIEKVINSDEFLATEEKVETLATNENLLIELEDKININ